MLVKGATDNYHGYITALAVRNMTLKFPKYHWQDNYGYISMQHDFLNTNLCEATRLNFAIDYLGLMAHMGINETLQRFVSEQLCGRSNGMDNKSYEIPGGINTLVPGWNRWHFANGNFKYVSWTKNSDLQKWVNCVPMDPIENRSALVRVMAWRWVGDNPLPGPKMINIFDAMQSN